jgi:hypothetical protein
MNKPMVQNAVFATVTTKRSEQHKHVNSISHNGRNTLLNTKDNLHLVSEELHKGQPKTCLGF